MSIFSWLPSTFPTWFPEWLVHLLCYTIATYFVIAPIIFLVRLCKGEEISFFKIRIKFNNRVNALENELNKRDGALLILKDLITGFLDLLPCVYKTEDFQNEVSRLYDLILFVTPQLLTSHRNDKKRVAIFEIMKVNGEGVLKIRYGSGFSSNERENLKFKPDEGLAGIAYTTGLPIISGNVLKDSRFVKRPESKRRFYSLLCALIKVGEKTEGVFSVDSTLKNTFKEIDIQIFEIVSYLIGQLNQIKKCPILNSK